MFVRPRGALYREYSREVWSIVREIVPTVEQAGIDEGYLDLGEVAPDFDDARALAEAVRAVVKARTRLSCSLGVATSKVVAKVASDRRKPGGLTVVRPGREAAFLAPFPIRVLPGVGPRAEARLAAAGVETIGALAALDGRRARPSPPRQGRAARARPCARDRPAAARGLDRAHLDLDRGDVRARRRRRRAPARRAARDGRPRSRAHLRERGQTARTVTTKLRYPDFAIRTRSTSLDVGTDDAGRIGELACWPARPRAARPARARCGSSASASPGLADHAQLELRSSDRVCAAVEGYQHATEIRVRFAETDAQGVAHHSNYLVWFEVARVEFLERFAGGYQRLRDEGIESLVARGARALRRAGALRRPAARARALPRRARRPLPVRVRGRARRRRDRRGLDGPRNGRRDDAAADADAGVARRALLQSATARPRG